MINKIKINWLWWLDSFFIVLIFFSIAYGFDYFFGSYRDEFLRYIFGDSTDIKFLRIGLWAFLFPIIYALMGKALSRGLLFPNRK